MTYYLDGTDRLHQEQWRFLKAQQRQGYDYRPIAWSAEREIILRCADFGYRVTRTVSSAPFDLWVEGVRVEVKAALWHTSVKGGGRYQAAIRNHVADVVIFDCINGMHHHHIIPMANVGQRQSLAVWSHDPRDSRGQWVAFLEQWEYLHCAVRGARQCWQPPLFTL